MLPVEGAVSVGVIWIWVSVEDVEDSYNFDNGIVDLERRNTELKKIDNYTKGVEHSKCKCEKSAEASCVLLWRSRGLQRGKSRGIEMSGKTSTQ